MRYNPHNWAVIANLLFLEGPIGTGFSYTENVARNVSRGDGSTADDNLSFLVKFLGYQIFLLSTSNHLILPNFLRNFSPTAH